MQTHRSSCLAGPVSRFYGMWQMNMEGPQQQKEFEDLDQMPQEDDPTFRADLVARVRRQIGDGTYDTEEKWEIALDRLLRHMDEMA